MLEQYIAKDEVRRQQQEDAATQLEVSLPRKLRQAVELRSSSWLSCLPIEEHGFALHKGTFRDALYLWFSWQPPRIPTNYVCGQSFFIYPHVIECSRSS